MEQRLEFAASLVRRVRIQGETLDSSNKRATNQPRNKFTPLLLLARSKALKRGGQTVILGGGAGSVCGPLPFNLSQYKSHPPPIKNNQSKDAIEADERWSGDRTL